MTEFIESFATQQLLPPWRSTNVSTWVFGLPLKKSGIMWFLDNFMNGTGPANAGKLRPAPFSYQPIEELPPYAFLVVADHRDAISFSPWAPPFGKVSSTLVYLTTPVWRYFILPEAGPDLAGRVPVWVQPFTCCDSSTWVFSAREIWGIDAQKMKMDFNDAGPVRPGGPRPLLHLDASYIGVAKFAPTSVNEMLAALHLDVTDEGETPPESPPDGIHPEVWRQARRLVGQGDTASFLVDTLKEFRSSTDVDQAIYRALVSSEESHASLQDVRYHGPDKVAVDFMWSDGMRDLIQKFLGVQPDELTRGPPAPHTCNWPPPPSQPGDAPSQTRWSLDHFHVEGAFCLSFTTDVTFRVLDTLHVYQPIPALY